MNQGNLKRFATAAREVAADIRAGSLKPGRGIAFDDHGPVCSMGHVLYRAGFHQKGSGSMSNMGLYFGVNLLPHSLSRCIANVAWENDCFARRWLVEAVDALALAAEREGG